MGGFRALLSFYTLLSSTLSVLLYMMMDWCSASIHNQDNIVYLSFIRSASILGGLL